MLGSGMRRIAGSRRGRSMRPGYVMRRGSGSRRITTTMIGATATITGIGIAGRRLT
jgi:hypothetical protein